MMTLVGSWTSAKGTRVIAYHEFGDEPLRMQIDAFMAPEAGGATLHGDSVEWSGRDLLWVSHGETYASLHDVLGRTASRLEAMYDDARATEDHDTPGV